MEPHDYQCERIVWRDLDGYDVIATMATGAGKTGPFSFLMLAVRAISQNPSLALQNRTFPKDPCTLVICPTNAIEEDMVRTAQIWLQIVYDKFSRARTRYETL
jgi:superfamily II DNA or RNA helicase